MLPIENQVGDHSKGNPLSTYTTVLTVTLLVVVLIWLGYAFTNSNEDTCNLNFSVTCCHIQCTCISSLLAAVHATLPLPRFFSLNLLVP